MQGDDRYEAIVIGGGPAGATAAAVLGLKGHRVVVLEKDFFPRYHIGESLIPYCYFPLQRIGMLEQLKASSFVKKYSVQFAGSNGKISQPFYFQQHLDHEASTTWQVVRSEFDQMLLDNAREKGAEVFQGMRVKQALEVEGRIVGVRALDGRERMREFRAPVTIDASGRNGFFVTRNGWRIPDRFLKKVSIWTYYQGARRDEGIDEGATTVAYLPEKGWFWYIPLPDDLVSVGVVADKEYLYRDTRDPAAIFNREVQNNLWIEEHLATGKICRPYQVTGDYSYRSKYSAADGMVLTGDALAFLDPVFSSGILLALYGGEQAAEAVDRALQSGDVSAGQFTQYAETLRSGMEAMRKLVYSFYDQEFNFGTFFKKYPGMVADVTDCLIGRLDRDYTQLFKAIAEFAAVPEDLPHGKPLIRQHFIGRLP